MSTDIGMGVVTQKVNIDKELEKALAENARLKAENEKLKEASTNGKRTTTKNSARSVGASKAK